MKSLMIAVFLAASALAACSPDGDANECPEGFTPSEEPTEPVAPGVHGDCAPVVESSEEALTLPAFPSQVNPRLEITYPWIAPSSNWLLKSLQRPTDAFYANSHTKVTISLPANAACQLGGATARCLYNWVSTNYACPRLFFKEPLSYVTGGMGKAGAPPGFYYHVGDPIPANIIRRTPSGLECSYNMSGFITYRLVRK